MTNLQGSPNDPNPKRCVIGARTACPRVHRSRGQAVRAPFLCDLGIPWSLVILIRAGPRCSRGAPCPRTFLVWVGIKVSKCAHERPRQISLNVSFRVLARSPPDFFLC